MARILSVFFFHLCLYMVHGTSYELRTVSSVQGTMIKTNTASPTRCALLCQSNSMCVVAGIVIENEEQSKKCVLFGHDEKVVSINIVLIVEINTPNMGTGRAPQQLLIVI